MVIFFGSAARDKSSLWKELESPGNTPMLNLPVLTAPVGLNGKGSDGLIPRPATKHFYRNFRLSKGLKNKLCIDHHLKMNEKIT